MGDIVIVTNVLLTTVSATITKKTVGAKNKQTYKQLEKKTEQNIEVVMLQSTVENTANLFFLL